MAAQAADGPGGERAYMTVKLAAACRAFRSWGLGHKEEFSLLFAVPPPGSGARLRDTAGRCAMEPAAAFCALALELWETLPFPVPAPAGIDPVLRAQLGRLRAGLRADAEDGTALAFLRCWTVLCGAVATEALGHLRFALDDPSALFELTLADLARQVGLQYPVPAPGAGRAC